jgi:acetyl-CoA C-acetyltransferase
MKKLRKKVYAAAGYNTVYFGSGRKDFDPSKPMRTFDEYLAETAKGTCEQVQKADFDEGFIGSFMSGRFIKQANLPGFLPFMVPSLYGKPCTGVEGACGTGGRAIASAVRSVLSDLADSVFVAGFEMQNTMKAVYGADVLAGAAFYQKERKSGHAFFFPGIFAERAGAYYKKYGYDTTRKAMAKWYENSILNARKNPKAQEYENNSQDLFALGMTPPDADKFVPYLNLYDCSKVSDGASSLLILSEEGLKKCGIDPKNAVEIVSLGEAEGDITQTPEDLTRLSTTKIAVNKALDRAGITIQDLALMELHDCFSITGLLALEALGFAKEGEAASFILEGQMTREGLIPVNLSGGLGGFGHPTGATGVRQLVDLVHQLTGKASNQAALKSPFGLMISMGGNDKTVTSVIVKKTH